MLKTNILVIQIAIAYRLILVWNILANKTQTCYKA